MVKKEKKTLEKKEAWFRIIVGIVTGTVLCVWSYLIGILFLINFFITIFKNKRNREIAEFCEYWNTESYRFMKYMTFITNDRPFPFTNMQKIGKFE